MNKYKFLNNSMRNEWNSIKSKCYRQAKRSCSSSSINQQLIVRSYGDPQIVVQLDEAPVPKISSEKQILVKFDAAPVNPADINTIQGVYAIKPDFPFVPGNEAVMTVLATGRDVTYVKEGDRVIPCSNAMGTWRNFALVEERELIKIPSHIDTVTAATIGVNPCTAYRMLHDFVSLKKGDVVIQNCANSAVGQAVIQIAAALGLQTVNIVRNRNDLQELETYLKNLGATLVITDDELRSSRDFLEFPKPKLALNGVSGKPATEMLRKLEVGGTMVTYGGMSKQPVIIPVGSLIFNNLIFRGFWMTRWNQLHQKDESRMEMLRQLFQMIELEKFKAPNHTLIPLKNFKQALRDAMPINGKLGIKQILSFD